jgi:hypothetical protein
LIGVSVFAIVNLWRLLKVCEIAPIHPDLSHISISHRCQRRLHQQLKLYKLSLDFVASVVFRVSRKSSFLLRPVMTL